METEETMRDGFKRDTGHTNGPTAEQPQTQTRHTRAAQASNVAAAATKQRRTLPHQPSRRVCVRGSGGGVRMLVWKKYDVERVLTRSLEMTSLSGPKASSAESLQNCRAFGGDKERQDQGGRCGSGSTAAAAAAAFVSAGNPCQWRGRLSVEGTRFGRRHTKSKAGPVPVEDEDATPRVSRAGM
jgi:hypothetical protein